MAFENDSFDTTKNPLVGGLNDDEMVTAQHMTRAGASHSVNMAVDLYWTVQETDVSTVNGLPTVEEDGVPLTDYLWANSDVYVEGITTCTLRPWFWNEQIQRWVSGTEETISLPRRLKTQVDGAVSFYVEIVEIVTDTPGSVKITIAIAGTSQ